MVSKNKKLKKIKKLLYNRKINEALQIAGEDIGLLFHIGFLAFEKEDDEMAEKAFDRIIQCNPDIAEA